MVLILCLSFNGCVNKNEVDISVINCDFKCDFNIPNSDLSGEMTVKDDGKLSMFFSGPDIINGVGITVAGETIIIEVKGITERYSRSTVPEDSPATYIYDILKDIKSQIPEIKNEEITVLGNSASGEYEAVLSGTGFVETLTLKDTGVHITFTNHVVLN